MIMNGIVGDYVSEDGILTKDYMDELYLHFGLDMYSEEYCGCDIIKEFETLFGKYQNQDYLYDIMVISFPFTFAVRLGVPIS